MAKHSAYSSIALKIPVTLDGVAVSLADYNANDALDGTKGSPAFKIVATVKTASGYATTVDSIVCNGVTCFRSSDTTKTNEAVLTLRKGFAPTTATEYTVVVWYDSTSGGSGGWRECGRETFTVDPVENSSVTPPY